MRHYLKQLIIAIIAFYAAYTLVPAISLGTDPQNMLIVIGAILITTIIVHPIFSIILLPINILTLGLMSLVLNVALVFVLIRFLPGFNVTAYDFPGANIQGFVIPAARLTQISTIGAIAVIITIVQKVLHFIFE